MKGAESSGFNGCGKNVKKKERGATEGGGASPGSNSSREGDSECEERRCGCCTQPRREEFERGQIYMDGL
eukprot:1630203-Rhodomonas_salina.2